MTDDAPKENDMTPLKVATADDLQAVDFQEAIASIERADCMALFEAFAQEAHAAEESGDAQKARVFGVLTSLCGMHLNPEDRANPFGPMWVADGKLSAIPDDVRGRQCEALSTVISQIRHPGLRARLADVVWCNDRKSHEAAQIAVAAYCETITALNSEALKPQFGDLGPLSMDRLNLMQRALQIASATSKQGELPDHVREVATALYDRTRIEGKCALFSKLGKLLLRYAVIDAAGFAQDSENMAQAAIDACEPFPLAIKAGLGFCCLGLRAMRTHG